MRSGRSLRKLLLSWLVPTLVTLLLAGAVTSYFIAADTAKTAYDRALHNNTLALSDQVVVKDGRVTLDLSEDAREVLLTDRFDRIYFLVLAPDGGIVAGNPGLPVPTGHLAKDGRVTFDGSYRGEKVRIAARLLPTPAGPALVEVAETLVKRNNMVREIILGMLIPEGIQALVAVALVWLGVTLGLGPLQELRAQIAHRSQHRLDPLSEEATPEEVKPVVHALNDLLEHLNQALSAQKRFIANAAHQLRTPLAGLQSQAELALKQPASPELHHTLEQIHDSAVRAGHLAHQLLLLARAEPGGRPLDARKPLDLTDTAHAVAEEWVEPAIRRGLDLGFDLEPAPVTGDPFLLHELLVNLVDNALRYCPAGSQVTVRTRRDGATVVLQVEDNGPGIPEPGRARVFERFYRGDERGTEGSGLGLAIVKEIAQAHEATVALRNPAHGTGTLIEVRFPAAGAGA